MIPGDRLVCTFTEDVKVGHTFQDWPLHITVVPWFRVPLATGVLSIIMQEKLAGTEPFTIVVGEEAGFGYRGKKLVNLVEVPSPLQKIETIIRSLLHSERAWIVDETAKTERQFRPHVTTQPAGRMQQGDRIDCRALYVVEQMGEHKQVVDKVFL